MVETLHEVQRALFGIVEFGTQDADRLVETDEVAAGFLIAETKKKHSAFTTETKKVPKMIPVLGSQPAGDVSHKPDGRLPLLSARPAVAPATLKRAATFAAW